MIKSKTLVVAVLLGAAVVFAIAIGSFSRQNSNVRKGEIPQVKEAQTTQAPIFKDITVAEANDLVQSNNGNADFSIIDVRTPSEYAAGHLAKAVNIDYEASSFRDELGNLDKNKSYLVYCRTGGRSANAVEVMREFGFGEVYNLEGGIASWTAQGLPTVR